LIDAAALVNYTAANIAFFQEKTPLAPVSMVTNQYFFSFALFFWQGY
jgi:hypothetical protein